MIEHYDGAFDVVAITANRNVASLADQACRLRARRAVVADPAGYKELKERLAGTGIEAAAGEDAVIEAAGLPSDRVMAAIVEAAGLAPTMAAIRRGAVIGLANKKCLVCAGDLMMAEIARCGATLVRSNSEHSAIYQVFDFDNADKVEQIILTASGGPFRRLARAEMVGVTPAQAVAHQLGHGGEDLRRLGDDDEQGPGADRGVPPVPGRRRADRDRRSSAVGDPQPRRLRGRLHPRPAARNA